MENQNVVAPGAGVPVALAPALLTINEAAHYVGGTPWAIRRLLWAGALPYVQVGKRFTIPREALDEWAKKNTRRNGQPAKGARA